MCILLKVLILSFFYGFVLVKSLINWGMFKGRADIHIKARKGNTALGIIGFACRLCAWTWGVTITTISSFRMK